MTCLPFGEGKAFLRISFPYQNAKDKPLLLSLMPLSLFRFLSFPSFFFFLFSSPSLSLSPSLLSLSLSLCVCLSVSQLKFCTWAYGPLRRADSGCGEGTQILEGGLF